MTSLKNAIGFFVSQKKTGSPIVGWHFPSEAEFLTMVENLGGESVAGGKLKETGYIHWYSPNTGATNESGFTALPAGYRIYFNGVLQGFNRDAIFYTSSISEYGYPFKIQG